MSGGEAAGDSFGRLSPMAVERSFGRSAEGVASNAPPAPREYLLLDIFFLFDFKH